MQNLEIGVFYVMVVTALRGGGTTEDETRYASRRDAIDEAEKLQALYDREAAPIRVYVADRYRVKVYAAGECLQPEPRYHDIRTRRRA